MGGAGGAPVPTIPDGIIEVEIPDQEDCENAYPHDPSVDEETGVVYWAGSNESCIGEFNPDTMEFRAWPTATADSYPVSDSFRSFAFPERRETLAGLCARRNPARGCSGGRLEIEREQSLG
jgi:hypothetical protein